MIEPTTPPSTTDSELRGIILRRLYEKRRENEIRIDNLQTDQLDFAEIGRICDQLAEHGLIKFKPHRGGRGRILTGYAQISARGIDVIEGTERSPIAIQIDHSRHYTVTNSDRNIFGDGNIQMGDITIGQIAQTIAASSASKEDKDKATSTIAKAFKEETVKGVLGTLAESVTKGIMNSVTAG